MTTLRLRWAGLGAALVVAGLLSAGWSGLHEAPSTHVRTAAPSHAPDASRQMTFRMANSARPVKSLVPKSPLASTPTSVPGVTLQLYLVQRISTKAVLIVFAVIAPSGTDRGSVIFSLGANGQTLGATVSGVSLLDPTGLKQYLPYMANPTKDETCVCTDLFDSKVGETSGPTPIYFAAVVAAPPETTHTVSFVTGLGTIPNVTLTK